MKKDIHPTYYTDAKITCACGATYVTGSTVKERHVELCAACHPFYTGKDKLVDTAGRVDRYQRMVAKRASVATVRRGRKAKKARAVSRKKAKEKKQR